MNRLAHTDTGTGPAVVLLHGLTCHLGYWQRVVPLLGDVRIVTVDLRGHGLSAHRDSYAYGDYVRDLLDLLDELGLEPAVVGGHSLGGYVALLAACRDERIARVVAIDVKSDWTAADAELAERSREGAQRVEPERGALVERLARSLAPTVLAADELELVAERGIEPVGVAGASAGIAASWRRSRSIRSPFSDASGARSRSWPGRRAR